jgi:hypothetical protein
MTLTHLRLRGLAALIAGIIFLLGVPIYRDLVLAPVGYVAAFAPITQRQHFGPFLLWASAHIWADTGYRIVELIPFLLAAGLPAALRRVLWPADPLRGRAAMLLGQIGFASFALAIIIAAFTVPNAAREYAADVAHRAEIEHSYIGLYAFESLLANVLAGGLIALFLVVVSLRGNATGGFPAWFVYLGLATAGLLGATAVLFLFTLTQSDTPTGAFAFLGLAFWLMAGGIFFLRVQARPRSAPGAAPAAAEPAAPGG